MFDAKAWLLGLGAIGAGGGAYLYADPLPAGVYRQPLAQVYRTLATAPLPFRAHDVASGNALSRSGDGASAIHLDFANADRRESCAVRLTPYRGRGDATGVSVTCSDGTAGKDPIGRAPDELFADAVAEAADAALTGRPLRSLKSQAFEAAASGGEGFNRAARDAGVMRNSINRQLDELRAGQAGSAKAKADRSLADFYADQDGGDDGS